MGEMVRGMCQIVVSALRSKRDLAPENAALRHQVIVLQRQSKAPRIENRDRASQTHQLLANDCPDPRPVEAPEMGDVIALSQVGGLHHRYALCRPSLARMGFSPPTRASPRLSPP